MPGHGGGVPGAGKGDHGGRGTLSVQGFRRGDCLSDAHVSACPGTTAVACDAAGEGEAGRGDHRGGQGRIPRRLSGYGAVQADVGLQAQAGRGAGGGDAERAFAVRRTAAFVQGGVGARRRGGVPVRGFCGMVD